MPDTFDADAKAAQHMTDERLAVDINRLADDIRFLKPDERAARLREAATRIAGRRRQQTLVTLPDGKQVAWLNGGWHIRRGVSDSWTLPLAESSRPHEPRTFYVGEW